MEGGQDDDDDTAGRGARGGCGALAFAALSASSASAQDKVVMRINFTPWAMHAQYYGGVAQGIYKAEGIDLEIRPPSAGQQNEVFIATGRRRTDLEIDALGLVD